VVARRRPSLAYVESSCWPNKGVKRALAVSKRVVARIGESALDVVTVHREAFVLVVPASHKLAKRKRVRLTEVSDEDFVMYERTYAPGFHDLILGILRDARIVPNASQSAAEISTLISLVDAHMGIAILPASAVKHSVASVIACHIVDRIPMSEIAMAVSKRVRAAVVDNFRSFALKKLGRATRCPLIGVDCSAEYSGHCYCRCDGQDSEN
jgi:DNA-binding transcriptional LysR family regulator